MLIQRVKGVVVPMLALICGELSSLRIILSELDFNQVDNKDLNIIKQFKDNIMDLLEKEDNNLDRMQQIQLKWTRKTIDEKIPINIE
jgi:hypothetical protein